MIGSGKLRGAIAFVVVMGCWGVGPGSAFGSVYTVDDFGDPNSLACAPDPAAATCSLRGAIKGARNGPDEAVIKLLPGTYHLNLYPNETGGASNLSGDLDWADQGPETLRDLRIEGPGSGLTTVDATGLNDRILEIDPSSHVSVAIQGVTLRSGKTTANDGWEGGAIRHYSDGPLFLTDVAFVDNTTPSFDFGNGGAIVTYDGSVSVRDATFSQDRAGRFGGGIAVRPAIGGGVPTVDVTNSTFTDNRAQGLGGGAIANMGDGVVNDPNPVVSVINSTFDGNRAVGFGGAIDTFGLGTTNLTFATVTRNMANADNAGGEAGGGLQNGGGTYTVKQSLIAANTVGTGGFNPNCSGVYGSLGANLMGDLTGCAGFNAVGDDVTSNPGIGPLSANGGPTMTVPLLAGSPAIDHALGCPNEDQPNEDQRGIRRPQGAACDSGAFEFVPPASPQTPAAAAQTGQRAAALKNCKKKKSKKARKKCRRKANKLPI